MSELIEVKDQVAREVEGVGLCEMLSLECMQVGKRPCLYYASLRSMMGSTEVGEVQPCQAP